MGDTGVELEILNEEEKKNEEPDLEEDDDQLVPGQKIVPPEKLSYPALAGVLGGLLVILVLIVAGITIVVVVYLETSTVIMYKKTSNSIIEESRNQADFVYNRLTNFSDSFPARISSSQNLLSAIDWVQQQLINDGFKKVRTQEVSVPNWQRNTGESLTLLEPRIKNMRILSLGNSVNTPQEGIQGEVLVVDSFQELTDKADQAYGKIVLFNAAFTTYSETVKYRIGGAVAAAKVNAKAALVRSITPFSLQTPHTGVMYYEDGIPQIPTAAVTIEDAEYLKRLQDQGVKIVVELKLFCETLEDTIAYNIIGEIPGSGTPEEIVLIGGHIDSWDVGNGAMDDGGGLVASWQACKLILDLGLTPRRTIRFIGWVDEENRSSGSVAYFDSLSPEDIANHILAIESDSGVFTPKSITIDAAEDSDQWKLINNIANRLMKEIGSLSVVTSDGGEDTDVLRKNSIPVSELLVDESQYFWYHHTEADTIDKLNKDQIADCAATLSILAYVIADFEKSLTSLSQ